MSNIIDLIKISFLDYRKFLLKTSTYIFVGIALIIALLSIHTSLEFYIHTNQELDITKIGRIFNFCMQFVIIFQATVMLTEEFRRGTIPFLFTSSKSRTQILFSKILSFVVFCITICLINFAVVTYYYYAKDIIVITNNYFGLFFVLYLVFAWFIGNYFLFFSVILKSRMSSLVTGMFFLFILGDFSANLANKFPVLDKFLRFFPFDGLLYFLLQDINIEKVISMLVFGLIFFVLSAVIFERQDLV